MISFTPIRTAGRQQAVAESLVRQRRALQLRPALGRGTARTRVRLENGLRCTIEDGAWRLAVDMPEKAGGDGSAPDPGVLGRGAFGSCLAVGYAQFAALRDVPIEELRIEVAADYDVAINLGLDRGRPAGYLAVQYCVYVRSSAPAERVRAVLDEAEACSPYFGIWSRALDLERCLHLDCPD